MYNVGCIDVMCSSVMELNVDANMIMLLSNVLCAYDVTLYMMDCGYGACSMVGKKYLMSVCGYGTGVALWLDTEWWGVPIFWYICPANHLKYPGETSTHRLGCGWC